jgi:hypothetical protein
MSDLRQGYRTIGLSENTYQQILRLNQELKFRSDNRQPAEMRSVGDIRQTVLEHYRNRGWRNDN